MSLLTFKEFFMYFLIFFEFSFESILIWFNFSRKNFEVRTEGFKLNVRYVQKNEANYISRSLYIFDSNNYIELFYKTSFNKNYILLYKPKIFRLLVIIFPNEPIKNMGTFQCKVWKNGFEIPTSTNIFSV